jgi:pullulanase
MNEFDNLVKYMHKNNINVILDVVYNHTFTNNILDNVFPNYYYRKDSKIMPVDQPAIASERLMVRRIIVESLK